MCNECKQSNIIYKCEACGKEFHSKRSLGTHKQMCEQYLKLIGKAQLIYECNGCHQQFNTRLSLQIHIRSCVFYIKQPCKKMHSSKYWNKDQQTYICECGKSFITHQSLNAHFSHCIHHNEAYGKTSKRKIRRGDECNFSKAWMGEEKFNKFHKQNGKKLHQKYQNKQLVPSWTGRHHTEESKQKIRQGTISYILTVKSSRPRYNKSAIPVLEQIAKEHGWNIQHAENGGEFYTGIGYFVDAYDKEKNIVVEYDEPHHYEDVENNVLKTKDLNRQQRIIEHLHCEFWRYNEKTKVLWKVN